MKRLALVIAALALSGCVRDRYITVHCVTQEQADELAKAEPPKVRDRLTGRAADDGAILAGSAVELRAWGLGLMGVVRGCAKPQS